MRHSVISSNPTSSTRRPRWLDAAPLVVMLMCGFVSAFSSNAAESLDPLITEERLAEFARMVDALRQELLIPGLSAAIVHDNDLVWAQGFGLSDVERGIEAAANTPYGLASLTKPFSAILLMRMVEQGHLDLDVRIQKFGVSLGHPAITVRHVLSHTSAGTPGSAFDYDGNRYSKLTTVIEQLHGDTLRNVMRHEILAPLEMNSTVLNCGSCGVDFFLSRLEPAAWEHAFANVWRSAATPYQYDADYTLHEGPAPSHTNAAAGLVSTVEDLARLVVALDQDVLLRAETSDVMFTATELNSGESAPYGLGWFVETAWDTRLIWHYGYGMFSSLLLIVPDENLALIVLANTQNLSRPFDLGHADTSVLTSPVALAFFKTFVLGPRLAEPLPVIDWTATRDTVIDQLDRITDPNLCALFRSELWSYRKLYAAVGRLDVSDNLYSVYSQAFPGVRRTQQEAALADPPDTRIVLDRSEITDQERTRWIGSYHVRAEDAGSGLPSDLVIREVDTGIGLWFGTDECQLMVIEDAMTLGFDSNPGLALEASEGNAPFSSLTLTYDGHPLILYERVE